MSGMDEQRLFLRTVARICGIDRGTPARLPCHDHTATPSGAEDVHHKDIALLAMTKRRNTRLEPRYSHHCPFRGIGEKRQCPEPVSNFASL